MSIQIAQQWIDIYLRDGDDPSKARRGIAQKSGLSVEDVDQLIAASGKPAQIDPETVALRNLREEAHARRRDPQGWREWSHEEY